MRGSVENQTQINIGAWCWKHDFWHLWHAASRGPQYIDGFSGTGVTHSNERHFPTASAAWDWMESQAATFETARAIIERAKSEAR